MKYCDVYIDFDYVIDGRTGQSVYSPHVMMTARKLGNQATVWIYPDYNDMLSRNYKKAFGFECKAKDIVAAYCLERDMRAASNDEYDQIMATWMNAWLDRFESTISDESEWIDVE